MSTGQRDKAKICTRLINVTAKRTDHNGRAIQNKRFDANAKRGDIWLADFEAFWVIHTIAWMNGVSTASESIFNARIMFQQQCQGNQDQRTPNKMIILSFVFW